jgi:hypothetical protein
MKAWVTKYALTKGILEVDVVDYKPGDKMIVYRRFSYSEYAHGRDFHFVKKEALERAEEMRLDTIQSLKKRIEKLNRMEFKS